MKRVTGCSPSEILNKVNIFNRNVEVKVERDHVLEKRKVEMKKNEDLTNEKRKDYIYQEGDMVMRKSITKSKIDKKWAGSFRVVKRCSDNVVELDEGNKFAKWNIKHVWLVRCFENGEGVGCGADKVCVTKSCVDSILYSRYDVEKERKFSEGENFPFSLSNYNI